MNKNKFTNWLAVISIAVSASLGITSALNIKLPAQFQNALGAIAALAAGGIGYSTGKKENLSD